jgi:hypothetical protein
MMAEATFSYKVERTTNGGQNMESNPDPDPDTVHDEQSFLEFARALHVNRQLADLDGRSGLMAAPRGWQNDTIEQFLEGAVAWAEDSEFGRTVGVPEDASAWRRFAVFLYAGKMYE